MTLLDPTVTSFSNRLSPFHRLVVNDQFGFRGCRGLPVIGVVPQQHRFNYVHAAISRAPFQYLCWFPCASRALGHNLPTAAVAPTRSSRSDAPVKAADRIVVFLRIPKKCSRPLDRRSITVVAHRLRCRSVIAPSKMAFPWGRVLIGSFPVDQCSGSAGGSSRRRR